MMAHMDPFPSSQGPKRPNIGQAGTLTVCRILAFRATSRGFGQLFTCFAGPGCSHYLEALGPAVPAARQESFPVQGIPCAGDCMDVVTTMGVGRRSDTMLRLRLLLLALLLSLLFVLISSIIANYIPRAPSP